MTHLTGKIYHHIQKKDPAFLKGNCLNLFIIDTINSFVSIRLMAKRKKQNLYQFLKLNSKMVTLQQG